MESSSRRQDFTRGKFKVVKKDGGQIIKNGSSSERLRSRQVQGSISLLSPQCLLDSLWNRTKSFDAITPTLLVMLLFVAFTPSSEPTRPKPT